MKPFNLRRLLPVANGYIIISILYYWFETPSIINPVAIGLLGVFGLHLFLAKGSAKMIFPTVFITLNLFMFLALFSEFREFTEMNKDAILLIGIGTLYLGTNILSAIVIMNSVVNSNISEVQENVNEKFT